MNLERITKEQFLSLLSKSLDSAVDECATMMSRIKQDPTDIGKYYDTMLTLLDSVNYNAALYCRAECLKEDRDIFYCEKEGTLPVLKFSKNTLKEPSNAYM